MGRGNLGQTPSGMVPGAQPGTVYVPGQGWVSITDWTEDIIYDAEQLPAAIAQGQAFTFFRNLQIAGVPKTRIHTNLDNPSQLPSDWRAIVYGVHVLARPGTPHDDVSAIFQNAWATFTTGGTQKREKIGPLWSFPSPYGLTGLVTMDGLAAPREVAQINNGVPSPAALGKLAIPIDIPNDQNFQAQVTFDVATNLTAITLLYFVLRAYIQKPVR